MIDVDDQVAGLEIPQVRQKRLGGRLPPLWSAPILLEDVGLGINLESGVRQPEPAGEPADGHEHGRVPRVFRTIDGNGEDVVLLQQLDRALGPARRRGDEQDRLSLVAEPSNLGNPIGNPALQLDGGLAANVSRFARSPATARRRRGSSIAS